MQRFEWRDGEVCEVGGGRLAACLFSGEYIERWVPDDRREIKSFWTGKSWILEKDDSWLVGPYYQRGKHAYSFGNPELRIEMSENARKRWWRSVLGGRPVYWSANEIMRDATTDKELFVFDWCWDCEAGFAVKVGEDLHFTDGVRKDLPMGKICDGDAVRFLRVSETEYSLRVGCPATGYRYILLDVAKWTCR